MEHFDDIKNDTLKLIIPNFSMSLQRVGSYNIPEDGTRRFIMMWQQSQNRWSANDFGKSF